MDRFDWLELKGRDAQPQLALKQAPHDGPSFHAAARRMREAAHFAAAATYYEKAVGFDPHNFGAWVEYIDTLVRCQRLEDADTASAQAHNEYRRVRVLYASRALTLAHCGRLNEAFPLSDVSLEGDSHWYARVVRAEIILLGAPEFYAEALEQLEQALIETSLPWEVCFIGGSILQSAGFHPLAAGYFSEAVHAKPSAIAGLVGLGDSFQALRLYEQALFYYQKAIQLEPRHELALERQRNCAPLLYGLTKVFRRENLRKRWAKAMEPYEAKPHPPEYDF